MKTEKLDTAYGKADFTYSKDSKDARTEMLQRGHKEAFDNGKPCYLNLIRHYGGGGRTGVGGIEFDMTAKLTQPIVMAEDDDYIATYRVPTTSNKQITDFVFKMLDEARMTPNNRNSVRVVKKKLKEFKIPNHLVDDMPAKFCVVQYPNGTIGTKTLWDMEGIAKLRQKGIGDE